MFKLFLIFLLLSHSISSLADWRLLGPGDADQVTSISIDNDGVIYVGTDIGGIYTSDNDGESWTPINNQLLNHDITTPVIHDPDNSDVHYVGTRGGLYVTKDDGESWANIRSGLPKEESYTLSGSVGAVALDRFNAKKIYMGLGYRVSAKGNKTIQSLNWNKNIYISDNRGEDWRTVVAFSSPQRVNDIVSSSQSEHLVYAATDKGLYRSKTGGELWAKLYDGQVLNILIFDNKPNMLIATCAEKGVIRSVDGGKTWNNINKGLSFSYHHSGKNRYSKLVNASNNPSVIYVTNSTWGRSGGLYKSTDYGESWKLISRNMPESWLKTSRRMNAVAVNHINNDIYLGSSRYIYKSTDDGRTWKQLISKYLDDGWVNTGINVFGHTRKIEIARDNPSIMYIATADHGMLKTNNGGNSWNAISSLDNRIANIWDIALCRTKPEDVYIVGSSIKGGLCVSISHNYGKTWSEKCNGLGVTNRNEKLYAHSDNCNKLYLAGKSGIRTTDTQANSWSSSKWLSNEVVNAVLLDKNVSGRIIAATNQGLFYSDNDGKTWHISSLGALPVTSLHQSMSNKNVLLLGTSMNGRNSAHIYKSNDAGETWYVVHTGMRKYVSAFAQSFADNNIIYAATNDFNYHDKSNGSGVFVSFDLGETWHSFNLGLPVMKAFNITTSEASPGSVFLSAQGSGVYRSYDPKKEDLLISPK